MSIYEILQDYTSLTVIIGTTLLCSVCGMVGTIMVLQRESLLADVSSHSALPGIVLIFIFTNTKTLSVLLLGASISSILGILFILLVSKYTKLKFDSIIAFTLSLFFGAGMILLTYIQKIPELNQAGINNFIFGQAASMLREEIIFIFKVSLFILAILILFYKEIKITIFDPTFAQSLGFSKFKIQTIISIMSIIIIITGLQSVGIILISATIIAPAVSSLQFAESFSKSLFFSSIIGGFSGFTGTLISSLFSKVPTGPAIAIILTIIAFFSLSISSLKDNKKKSRINKL